MPPSLPVLPENVQLLMEREDEEDKLNIAPPLSAEFPVKVLLVMMGEEEEEELYIAPPLPVAELPVKVALLMVGEEEDLYIAPPELRVIENVSTAMLLLPFAFPPLTVNPSNTVVAASDTEITTW